MELKKATEVVILGGVLAVAMTASMNAEARAIGSSATAQANVSITSGEAGGYVVSPFAITLSAHTALAFDGSPTQAGVKSMNSKGMHSFGGSTAGGSVTACEISSIAFAAPTTASTVTGC
ncbi:hypothetical protein [Chitinimonas naiadis]